MEYIYKMPEEMLKPCAQQGRVERFEYDTENYEEDHKKLHKGAWVYLPYGYDEADGSDKEVVGDGNVAGAQVYNVLYLLHGGAVTEDWWFKMFPETVTILDNMIARGICGPCIIVCPTYYRGEDIDRNAEYITEHFHFELRRNLIPAVEKNYRTFAQADTSEAGLIATREHRAFAGLSLGSMTTYRAALYNNFDLFAWYGPFSGCCGPFGDHDLEIKRICETLSAGEKQGYDLKYMFCGNGDQDIAYAEHKDIMERVIPVCPQIKPGVNYEFYTIPGGTHDMWCWQLHLYHALQVFFG